VSNEPIETDQDQDPGQVPIRIIRTDGRHTGRLCSTFVYCLAPAELEPEVLGTLLDAVTDEDIAACLEVSADELGLRVVYGRTDGALAFLYDVLLNINLMLMSNYVIGPNSFVYATEYPHVTTADDLRGRGALQPLGVG
jgi:hypothetical protein